VSGVSNSAQMANIMKHKDVPQDDDGSASELSLPCSDLDSSFKLEKVGVAERRVTVDSSLNKMFK
jgi:hypothetical protein